MSDRTYKIFMTLVGAVCGYVVIKRFLSPDSLTLRNALIQGFFVGFGLAVVTIEIFTRIKITRINGWVTAFGCGLPGNGMFTRAAHTRIFPGPINQPQEAMYWRTNVDGAGHALSGKHDYIMHFPPEGLPPNDAFWSLTMADAKERFVANPLNRYLVGDRSGLVIFCSVAIAAWFVFIYFWPRLLLDVYKRAILNKGFEGPIAINTLATEPQELFADPLHPPASATRLATTGAIHDTLLAAGVLDLRSGPQVLHVPEMAGRYYSVQFTAPNNTIFAYVGKRTTGTQAGNYLITGPGWKGTAPSGMKQISSPNNSVFVLGRILVYSDSDLPTAHALTKQIQVVPLTDRQR